MDNETSAGTVVVPVTLVITGAGLDIDTITGELEAAYKSTQDKSAKLKYNFKKNQTMTGVFNANKTKTNLGRNGGYVVSLKGVIESQGGGAVTPTGPIQVRIGDDLFTAGDTKTLALTSTGKIFKLKSAALVDTGLPGVGGEASHRLLLQLLVPTAGGTNLFESVIELKRKDPAKGSWAR
ncbi:hypothetical protein HQ590_11620 [bacterium]|nr:hypothetical protein [bacterium]